MVLHTMNDDEKGFEAFRIYPTAIDLYKQYKDMIWDKFERGTRFPYFQRIQFIDDRLRDGKTYVPFSYFKGATPENDYTPDEPFTVTVESNPYSDDNEGYMKLFIKSGGADSAREVILRRKGDGKWLLWDQMLLPDIRVPKSANPWA